MHISPEPSSSGGRLIEEGKVKQLKKKRNPTTDYFVHNKNDQQDHETFDKINTGMCKREKDTQKSILIKSFSS